MASTGDAIVPLCPYIAKYLQTHEVPGAEIRWPQRPGSTADGPVQKESAGADEDPTGRAE